MKTVLAAVLLTVGLLLALWVNACDPGTAPVVPEAPAYPPPDLDDIRQEGERLDGLREAVFRFSAERCRMKEALLSGTVTLAEAADRLVESARRDSPVFLQRAADRFPGLSQ